MDNKQLNLLLTEKRFIDACSDPELIKTHISWVILCDKYVYKIKKPIRYSFLDFSTVQKRKFYCKREIELNRRLTEGIYLDVLPIFQHRNSVSMDRTGDGRIIDYAVRMKKLEPDKRMDLLLKKGVVTKDNINAIVEKLIPFHQKAEIIEDQDPLSMREKFNDLMVVHKFLKKQLSEQEAEAIPHAVKISDRFLTSNKELLQDRVSKGFIRDCHGDLHSRNIFLTEVPVIFDCIEFNDDFRQMDLLNELGFFCMDLDSFGASGLSTKFFDHYNHQFKVCSKNEEKSLFIYYKAYRANVRAKVNALRAKSADDDQSRNESMEECIRYLELMDSYLHCLHGY